MSSTDVFSPWRFDDSPEILQVLDSIEDGIVVIRHDRRPLFANRAALAFRGLTRDAIANLFCYEIAHRSGTPCTDCGEYCVARRVFETGESVRTMRVCTCADQSKRYFEIYATPLIHPGGDVDAVVEVIRDVTEQLELEAGLRSIENVATLGRIAAGIVHEVNSSMASVVTCAEGLLRAFQDPRVQDLRQLEYFPKYLETMRDSAYRCKKAMEDALRLVREEEIHWDWVNIHQVLGEVLPLLEYEAKKAGKRIETRWAEGVQPIYGDAQQLARVFLNLIHNALDALADKADGYVSISTRRLPEGVQVIIMDTGCGIPPEYRNKIFEPFFTTKPSGKGSGLGLPVSLQILERHKAKLVIESEVGIGTTLLIDFVRDPRKL